MNTNVAGLVSRLEEYLTVLDEPKRKLFFACLDCLESPTTANDGSLPPSILDVSAFVVSQTQDADASAVSRAAAALGPRNKPKMPPIYAPLGYHASSIVGVQKKDSPINGTPLLDGQCLSWAQRLKEMAVSISGGTGETVPLIKNYEQACQMFSEYASLEFKTVPDNNAADFPVDEAQQRELVALIYEAIVDMSDILERKSPITLKKANTSGAKHDITNSGCSPCQLEHRGELHSQSLAGESTAQDMRPPPAPSTTTPIKDNISVSKVKGLSRIEVWLLSWMILFSTHDIHRGRLPFLPWSKTDWGWDHSFSTFRQRLDAVITTLRRSKAAVCSLLESDYKSRLEAHPIREYRRKENNRAQNSERNAQVFIGRHTISKGNVQRNSDGSLSDAQGNIVAPGDANHRGLIDQTIALSQMGNRGPKAKREDGGHGQAVTRRITAVGVQKRVPKNKAESFKISRTKIDAAVEAQAAAARPKIIVPKPASNAVTKTAATAATTGSGLRTSPEVLRTSDTVAPVPSVECDYDPSIKSIGDADAAAALVPSQLMTPPPERPRITGLPPPQGDYASPSPATLDNSRSSQPDDNSELVSALMSETGPIGQGGLGMGLYGGINYAPAGYLDASNSIYFADNQWAPLVSQPCPRYDINTMSQAVGMQALNGMGAFNLQQSATPSFHVGPYASTTFPQADDAAMNDAFLEGDALLQTTRLPMTDIDSDPFINMAPSVNRDWGFSEAEMGQLPLFGMDNNTVSNWDEDV